MPAPLSLIKGSPNAILLATQRCFSIAKNTIFGVSLPVCGILVTLMPSVGHTTLVKLTYAHLGSRKAWQSPFVESL